MADPKNLSPEVVALLKKGDKLGAMKLMLQAAAQSGQANVKITTTASLPPDVQSALRNGNKIEAIKLLRERIGVGLAEAKGIVDSHEASSEGAPVHEDVPDHMPARRPAAARPSATAYVKRDGLSPGEVPRTHGGVQAAIFLIAIAAAVGLYFAFS